MNGTVILLALIGGLLFYVYFVRRILRNNEIVSELNETRLLIQKMAEQAGVSKEDINFIIGKDSTQQSDNIQRLIKDRKANSK